MAVCCEQLIEHMPKEEPPIDFAALAECNADMMALMSGDPKAKHRLDAQANAGWLHSAAHACALYFVAPVGGATVVPRTRQIRCIHLGQGAVSTADHRTLHRGAALGGIKKTMYLIRSSNSSSTVQSTAVTYILEAISYP